MINRWRGWNATQYLCFLYNITRRRRPARMMRIICLNDLLRWWKIKIYLATKTRRRLAKITWSIYICHARMILSGIHVFKTAGLPLKACGNDILYKRLNVQLVFAKSLRWKVFRIFPWCAFVWLRSFQSPYPWFELRAQNPNARSFFGWVFSGWELRPGLPH